MAHPFEVRKQIEVDATPEEVWQAIATGEGMDGWFLATGNEVEGREGGHVRVAYGGGEYGESTVTAWDPPHRFAHASEAAPDGSLHAFEYVVEGHGGRTLVRIVHSGFLGGDWEAEYDGLNEGDFMYLHLMAQYLAHFRGRRATVVTVVRPDEPDRGHVLAAIRRGLGLAADAGEGAPVHVAPAGLQPIDGVVDFVSGGIIGVRTGDALYRFLHAPGAAVYLGHHVYREGTDAAAEAAGWQRWLDAAFSPAA